MLVTTLVSLLALLACTAVLRVFPSPIIDYDTVGYWIASTGKDNWFDGLRPPAYGWLLRFAVWAGHARIVIAVQAGSWTACIGLATCLTGLLTKSALKAWLVGIGMLLAEVWLMHLLPAQWLALTDPLYADWIMLGYLLIVLATVKKSLPLLFIGCGFIGAATAVRPLLVALLIGSLFACTAFAIIRMPLRRLALSACVATALLFGPVGWLSGLSILRYGSAQPTSLLGIHMVMFTAELLQPADIVFGDAAVNREFHRIFETQSVPAGFSKDIYGIPRSKPWYPLIAYYISLSNETDMSRVRFTVDRISRDIAWRVIRLHPMEYARLVIKNLFFYLVPTEAGRWYFWPDNPLYTYGRTVYWPHPPTQFLLPLFYGERGYPNTDRMNLTMWNACRKIRMRVCSQRSSCSVSRTHSSMR